MTARTVEHETIIIEHVFQAATARVFAAWSRAEIRRTWMIPNDDWVVTECSEDFRVGGTEITHFGPRGDPHLRAETRYLNIVEDQRIVMAGSMFAAAEPISCSMATVELLPTETGTRMIYTEQAAFLDGRDQPASRRQGWKINIDRLVAYLRTEHR